MRKLIRYCFWRIVYLFRRRTTDFGEHLQMLDRTRWPWKKFRPNVWHNDDGAEWHVYLADERSYTAQGLVRVDLHISEETGCVIGFDMLDEDLEDALLCHRRTPAELDAMVELTRRT